MQYMNYQIHKIHIVMIVSMVLSLIIYGLSLYFLRDSLLLSYVINVSFILKLMLITLISWAPPFIFKILMRKFDPSDYEKVMRYKKTDIINFNL